MARILRQRGRQWVAHIQIPRPLRRFFLSHTGKPKDSIWEPLGADLSSAKPRAAQLAASYEAVFARLRAGEQLTPDQIEASIAIDGELVAKLRREIASEVASGFERSGGKITIQFLRSGEAAEIRRQERAALVEEHGISTDDADRLLEARRHGLFDGLQKAGVPLFGDEAAGAETITQAAEHWYAEMMRPGAEVKAATLDGHRLRIRAFIEHAGDLALTSVSRTMASDFLTAIAAGGRSNRTVNIYATTLACLFKSAKQRGRFQGENPFDAQKRRAEGKSYEAFRPVELDTLFAALPREIAPLKHTPDTALPWAALIGVYSGMRLEEIAQLTVSDVKNVQANGGTLDCLDIHNGDPSHHIKNKSAARMLPIHSELFRAGLLDYVKALPADGPLFPGLTRRASKGGKVGARLGELFRKRLVALGLKRDGLCFHSLRHSVAGRLEAAAVSQTDAARVLGHAVAGMSYGTYSSGPGLKRLAGIVEALRYDDVPSLKI
jgi:integrase